MDGGGDRAGAGPTSLLDALRAAVVRHELLCRGDRVLVAVSGGPDSTALLHALTLVRSEYDLTLGVCHVHHGLRPEADRDAAFVEELAARLDCPVAVERVAVPLGPGRSPEEVARVARYAALARAADGFGAERIALGHTADDQAETVLMRLLQGAGPRGLGGMPIRRGRLVRPLLDVTRVAVRAHLAAYRMSALEDETNRDPKFLRNRIRRELLPLLALHWGPRVPEALRRVARASRETVEALDALLLPRVSALVRPGPAGWAVAVAGLRDLPAGAVKGVLRLVVAGVAPGGELRAGLRASHLTALSALLDAPVGSRVRLPGRLLVERSGDALWIGTHAGRPGATPLGVPGEVVLPAWRLRLTTDLVSPLPGGPADPAWEAWFDTDALAGGLEIRPRDPTDRVVPFGGDRPVRVSRLLAAAATPRLARPHWPVVVTRDVASGTDELVWVVGVRRGASAPVTRETKTVVRIRAASEPRAWRMPIREELT